MDKFDWERAEIAAWKEKHVPIDRNGDDALVMHKMADGSREFIVAHGYDEETGHWGHGRMSCAWSPPQPTLSHAII